MNPDTTIKIVGPPGTGKTTTLLGTVEKLLEDSFSPKEICFCAFTRKAAHEARDRACEKFSMNTTDLPWFRTLHSLAFHQLGMGKNQVLGFGDYIKMAQMLGLSITFRGVGEDGTISALSKGDRLFFTENMARAQMIPLKEYWDKYPDEDIYWYELEQLQSTLLEYKASFGKQDFTDIITTFCNSPVVPPIRALIVDEAQDLTPLQWNMVEHLARDVEEVHVAGDDDQAIFRWAGADVDRFINLPGHAIVLPQSYRVPAEIQQLAETVVSRIDTRIPKKWLPSPHGGTVNFETEIEHIDMSQGSWYLLGRNAFTLEAYNNYCISMGFVFDSSIGSPIRGTSLQAIRAWESLRKGESVTGGMAKKVYDLMTTKVGVVYGFKTKMDKLDDAAKIDLQTLKNDYGLMTQKIWHEALDKMDAKEVEYFLAALRRGEKLLKEPRIKINTIHGVKGGEADNVVIQTDMAWRTFNEYMKNPDDEHRVWYVAITRARKNVYIISPRTERCYQI